MAAMETDWMGQFRRGLVELAVLGVVARLPEDEAYGYHILRCLGEVEGLSVTASTVYPILARLTKEELLRVRTGPSAEGPARRYYRLTPAGRARLGQMTEDWRTLARGLEGLLSARGERRAEVKYG